MLNLRELKELTIFTRAASCLELRCNIIILRIYHSISL